MTTLKDLRFRLRGQLDDWPNEDMITYECAPEDKWIVVNNSELYVPGKLLAIERFSETEEGLKHGYLPFQT